MSLTAQNVYDESEIIIFDRALLNVANSYNLTSGIFTVPVTGGYMQGIQGTPSFLKL